MTWTMCLLYEVIAYHFMLSLLVSLLLRGFQISGYLAGLFNSHLIKRVMIVAPKTLIPHWMKELSVVGLSQKIRE